MNDGTVEVSGSFLSMGGNVTGSGQLRKTGPGNLSLANGNTYAGGTLVSGGTVKIVANSGLGLNSGDVTLGDGDSVGHGRFYQSASHRPAGWRHDRRRRRDTDSQRDAQRNR